MTPRTLEETAVFNECLPNMGALYSMFPVLVLSATPEDDVEHNYTESGWCTCEFTVAMLGGQVRKYSSQMITRLARASTIKRSEDLMDRSTAKLFKDRTHAELRRKFFLHDSDRQVALGIISGFLIKRTLVDAIKQMRLEEVESLLSELSCDNLHHVLDEPIDEHLNTLLHLAVQHGNDAVTKALLKYGARSTLCNIRGDTPAQWFMLPRWNAAAAACRADTGYRKKCPPAHAANERELNDAPDFPRTI